MGYIGEFKLLSGAVVKKSKLLNELKSELTICLLETESLPPLFSLSIYTYWLVWKFVAHKLHLSFCSSIVQYSLFLLPRTSCCCCFLDHLYFLLHTPLKSADHSRVCEGVNQNQQRGRVCRHTSKMNPYFMNPGLLCFEGNFQPWINEKQLKWFCVIKAHSVQQLIPSHGPEKDAINWIVYNDRCWTFDPEWCE